MNVSRGKIKTIAIITVMTLMIVFLFTVATVSLIQAFKCPEMTQTQILMRVTESIKLNFIECE